MVEFVLEAAVGTRRETMLEIADVIYHVIVLWVEA
ncbi:hypothetical protein GXW78_10585 [Roseomonas terrae]|uniref:Phosphoribosyl-ATP diphosphatase n=1 Tax=Neoroseomonas terrae TaxID=424799 RepID=A0ABS5EGE9_9PROT|nr:hypothetical protein [Neoroseomonas terrae]